MKWVIIKGVRYPMSVVSAFAAYYGNNSFLKIRIRNKYHIIYFDNMYYLNIQIRYLKDIGYHKIGSIFKYNTGMEKIELEVIEIDDSSCDGCVFNNRGYYCMYSCCCNIDREDNTNVIYKEVKRS